MKIERYLFREAYFSVCPVLSMTNENMKKLSQLLREHFAETREM